MAIVHAQVLFNTTPHSVVPPMVIVNKGLEDGIQWTAQQTGWTLEAVAIDVGPDLTSDFHTPVTGTTGGSNPRSTLTISDDCTLPDKTEIDYKYTLRYREDSTGDVYFLDPTIRHRG